MASTNSIIRVFAVVMSLGLVQTAHGDETFSPSKDQPVGLSHQTGFVPDGQYDAFNYWQKLRLGATTLANPGTAVEARVVFGFEADEVLETQPFEDVVKNLKSGEIAIGIKDHSTNSMRYIILGENSAVELVGKIKSGDPITLTDLREKASKPMMFFADTKVWGQAKSKGRWISWPSGLQDNLPSKINKLRIE